jgi:hypothetical protein
MMKRNFIMIPALAAFQLLSIITVAQEKPSLAKMTWLVGSWKGMASGTPFYEAWRKVGANELRQYGIKITQTDTTISESGKILIAGDKATYGDDQHSWTLNSLTSEEMVFVNPQISFPRTITWKKMPNDHWYCLLKTDDQKIEYDIVKMPELDKVVDRWIKVNKKS